MILHVRLEVLGETVDSVGEESDLDLRGARIGLVETVPFDERLLAVGRPGHADDPPPGGEPSPPIAIPRVTGTPCPAPRSGSGGQPNATGNNLKMLPCRSG